MLKDQNGIKNSYGTKILGFEQNLVGNALRSCSQMKENNMLQSYNENIAMIGMDSMQKANSTLEDFVSIFQE
jgi:hypothetical protein